jgi:hypothetical protein
VTHPGLAEPRTKEDWRDYIHYQPPPKPVLPTRTDYQTMREDERRRFDRARSHHHSALVLAWTPPVQRFENEIFERLEANQAAPAGARPGLLIDGPAAVGKSTLVKMIARKFERQLRADEPHRFTNTLDDHIPVIYLSIPDQVTPKQISLALARYLHLPTRGTKDDIDDVILKAIKRCGVQLLVIDDLHFLDCSQREGRASNDHIKYLANHAPCTLVGTGIDLEDSPLLSEGGGAERATQTAGRFAHHKLAPFSLASKAEAAEWIGVVKTLEDALVLFEHEPGSLARRHWRYLHDRTSGSIAALHNLIRLGAVRAVRIGQEAVTRDLLDGIRLDYTSERRHAQLENAKAKQGHRGAPTVARDARNEVRQAASDPRPSARSTDHVANQ